jgi:diacylglycerol kinase (ATP)|tara:strand:- start:1050 stop:1949 length:900 start_codon:yes stop_codon:yes gene_type:complete
VHNIIILANPSAGAGQAQVLARRLIQNRQFGSDTLLLEPTSVDRARSQLDQALTGEDQRLVVIGGDGTLHLAVNRVLEKGLGEKITFSLLPAGSGSDFFRSLRYTGRTANEPGDSGQPRSFPVDALQIQWADGSHRYGINTVSAGIAGDISAAMAASATNGFAAYLRATLKAFLHHQPGKFLITIDSEPFFRGALTLIAVTNGAYFGQGMKVAPKARISDGQAELVAARAMSRQSLFFRILRIYLGNHLGAPYVLYRRGREISIHQASPGTLDIDGEHLPGGDLTIRVIPDALKFSCDP